MKTDTTNPATPLASAGQLVPAFHALNRRDEHFYEELSRVNNELANLQRELARTNADLAAAQKKLEVSEQRYRNLNSYSPTGILEFDADGCCLYANPQWQAITGLTADESLGDGWQRALDQRDATAFLEERNQARQTGREFIREVRIVNTRGDQRWTQFRSRAMPAESGEAAGRVSTVEDITENKVAESELRKLSRAVKQSPVSIVITDLQGMIEYVNPKFCALTGYSFEDMRGENPRVLKSGEMPPEAYRQMWATITAGEDWHGEFHNRKKNGELYWESATISPIHDDLGKVTHFVAVKEDITGRKLAEAALREQLALRERLAKIAVNVPGIIYSFRLRPDGAICLPYASPTIEEFFGVRAEDLVTDASSLLNQIHPEDRPGVDDSIAESARTMLPWRAEFRVRHPKKGLFWAEGHSTPERETDGSILWHGFIGDVTERKRREQNLRESEEKLSKMFESSPVAISLSTVCEGRLLDVNEEYLRMVERTRDEVVGRSSHEIGIWVDPAQRASILNQLSQKTSLRDIELDLRAKSGRVNHVLWSGEVVVIHGERCLLGSALDITGRKQAEKALRDIELRLAHAMRLAQLVEWEYDVTSGLFSFSDRYYALHGTTTELEGGNLMSAEVFARKFVHPDDAHLVADEIAKCVGTADPNYISEIECRILRRDGDLRHVLVHIAIAKDSAGRTIQLRGANQDITARKQAQAKREQLERQLAEHKVNEENARLALEHEQKSSQIKSRFVSMVSHEFRTPLSVINMAAELLDGYLDKMTGAERSEHLTEIRSSVERMTQMMNDFLIHGNCANGKMECKPACVQVEALCRRLIAEVPGNAGSPPSIECAVDPAVGEAWLDEKIMRHILGNLLSNAVKYSSDGQPVKLEVKRVVNSLQPNGTTDTPAEPHLEFKVSDAGIGIPAADLGKLYQTFHRAANVGNRPGTGMGLAIVKQFVDLARGSIQIESQEGKGTTVRVHLPAGN